MRNLNKIFIIEDDMSILYGLRDVFASNDFEVDFSDSRSDADAILDKIRAFKPDSIILDIVLPDLDGEALMREIKSDSSISNSEIFIFSDLSEDDGKARSVGLGSNYYFMKSEFDVHSFAAKVMKTMDGDMLLSQDEKDDDDKDDFLVMD